MKIVPVEQALVIDDLLPADEFELLWRYLQGERYENVHRMEWVKAWRFRDGSPLRGPVTLSHPNTADRINRVYPSGLGIDLLIAKMHELEAQIADWAGVRGVDWSYFFCRPYIYPPGTALSWHRDNQHNTTAAFTYYCHPTWNVQWGGELLIAGEETRDIEFEDQQVYGGAREAIGTHMDNRIENEGVMAVGAGQYIFPKPNRLVVLPVGVLHCIKRVEESAGDNARVTLQGTFMFPDRGKESADAV